MIKGVDMPTNGNETIIRIQPDGAILDQYGHHLTITAILVPTPHGRLIDADALEDYVIALKRDAIHAYGWTGKSGEWNARIGERERFAVMIEDAPTIIEAEGEDE